jgi:arginyl-tRNA synthetase
LVCAIGHFPNVVASGEPHRVALYLEALTGAFFDVHDACPVLPVGDADVTDLHRARLALVVAARRVLANGLGLLGVSAPERI